MQNGGGVRSSSPTASNWGSGVTDQTRPDRHQALQPGENYFDAEGLTSAEEDHRNRASRSATPSSATQEVAIAHKDLEARQQTLTIERTKKEAELSQERDIANKTASTRAEAAQARQTAKLTGRKRSQRKPISRSPSAKPQPSRRAIPAVIEV